MTPDQKYIKQILTPILYSLHAYLKTNNPNLQTIAAHITGAQLSIYKHWQENHDKSATTKAS